MHVRRGLHVILAGKTGILGRQGAKIAILAAFAALSKDIQAADRRAHQSDPFVEGMVPNERGSSSSATRSARAKALNTVSHW